MTRSSGQNDTNIRTTSTKNPWWSPGVHPASLRGRQDDGWRQAECFAGGSSEEVRQLTRDSMQIAKPDMKSEPHQRPARN